MGKIAFGALVCVTFLNAGRFVLAAQDLPASTASPAANKVVKEAESLILVQNRQMACEVLERNLKRLGDKNKNDRRLLKEKIDQLSRLFFTDKGFQNYLAGQEFFKKQKFIDAADKLSESDEEERGNLAVSHWLTLSYLWLGKTAQAAEVNGRALQLYAQDLDALRDEVLVLVAQEDWPVALKKTDFLVRELGDSEVQVLQSHGLALLKTKQLTQAQKYFDSVIEKEKTFPESYFWKAESLSSPEAKKKLYEKYLDLCRQKPAPFFAFQPDACTHVAVAQKGILP